MDTQSGLEPMVHGTQTWPPHGPNVGGPRNRYGSESDSSTEVTLDDTRRAATAAASKPTAQLPESEFLSLKTP